MFNTYLGQFVFSDMDSMQRLSPRHSDHIHNSCSRFLRIYFVSYGSLHPRNGLWDGIRCLGCLAECASGAEVVVRVIMWDQNDWALLFLSLDTGHHWKGLTLGEAALYHRGRPWKGRRRSWRGVWIALPTAGPHLHAHLDLSGAGLLHQVLSTCYLLSSLLPLM